MALRLLRFGFRRSRGEEVAGQAEQFYGTFSLASTRKGEPTLRQTRRFAIPLLLISLLVGHLVPFVYFVLPDLRRINSIQQQMVTLNPDERLTRRAKPAIDAVISESGSGDQELQLRDTFSDDKYSFKLLHRGQVDQFVNNPGFGAMRLATAAGMANCWVRLATR